MPTAAEWIRSAIREATNGNTDYVVTLEAQESTTKWIQLSWDTINAAYPAEYSPEEKLAHEKICLPALVTITAWEPNQYVTFAHGADPIADLAAFVEDYASKILGVDSVEDFMSTSG